MMTYLFLSTYTEWDKRRLSYLHYLVQEDIKLALSYHNAGFTTSSARNTSLEGGTDCKIAMPQLQSLLEDRGNVELKEKGNMLLLLLLAGLEFSMSIQILERTFQVVTLEQFG